MNKPSNFIWKDIHVDKTDERKELVTFLDKYYVRDEDDEFSLYYTDAFLKWHLCGPSYDPELYVSLFDLDKNIIVGFISGKKTMIEVNKVINKVIEINFLCIHSDYREQRMTPILLKEITRRAKNKGYDKAIYTGGKLLNKPIAHVQMWHRPLHLQPLISTDFISVSANTNIPDVEKYLSFSTNSKCDLPANVTFRPICESDLVETYKLFMNHYCKYSCRPIYNFAEFKHIFFNNDNVTCYVIVKTQDDGNTIISDMISYYILRSRVLKNNQDYQILTKACLYHYVHTGQSVELESLIENMMIVAKNAGLMVFNAITVMDNDYNILKSLKFNPGTGKLYYYLHNWDIDMINCGQIATILM